MTPAPECYRDKADGRRYVKVKSWPLPDDLAFLVGRVEEPPLLVREVDLELGDRFVRVE